uniref:Ig-like domain-containing protein n=1 Tax=Pundamilia nyererei TaxID=303518 RepID=A0A3B4F264_9CICH
IFGLKINHVWFFSVCDIHFLKQYEGESVVLPCEIEQRYPAPLGVSLKRSWLVEEEVLFKYTKEDFTVKNSADKSRISVRGDPSLHSVNITICQLNASDTDRYYCEFVVENLSSADDRIRGKMEFFLLVGAGECNFKMMHFDFNTGNCECMLILSFFSSFHNDCQCKGSQSMKSHEADVYEEMGRATPPSQTQAPAHQREITEASQQSKLHLGNPYEFQEVLSSTS